MMREMSTGLIMDAGKAGLKRDEEDVRKLVKEFERFQVF